MKKVVYILSLLILLTNCKSWDATKIGVKKDPINPKLLTLDRKIEDMANATVLTSEDQMKVFTKEVEENLTDPYGDKYGYMVMKQNIIKYRIGIGWALINGFTAAVPLLFGCPSGVHKYTIEVELRVMDSQNRLVGKYSAVGKSKVVVAAYWGYGGANAMRKAYVDAINNAFDQIRPLINADVTRVNEKLMASGKLR